MTPLRVIRALGRGDPGRFAAIIRALPDIWAGKVLDVGCRSGRLRQAIGSRTADYFSLDLHPPADVVADLEEGLPFPDRHFDCVAGLDVLEHTDEIHRSFDELCRVSRRHVVLALPNVYHVRFRLRYLAGLPISAKYGLSSKPAEDRHRWVFSFREAREFCLSRGRDAGFRLDREFSLLDRRQYYLGGCLAARLFPNLFCFTYLVALIRETESQGR